LAIVEDATCKAAQQGLREEFANPETIVGTYNAERRPPAKVAAEAAELNEPGSSQRCASWSKPLSFMCSRRTDELAIERRASLSELTDSAPPAKPRRFHG